jgi:hypothetical protein
MRTLPTTGCENVSRCTEDRIVGWTHDSCGLSLLTVGRAAGQPAHGDAVAAVEALELLERNLWLASLGIHESLTADEEWLLNVERLTIATVDDDGDSR